MPTKLSSEENRFPSNAITTKLNFSTHFPRSFLARKLPFQETKFLELQMHISNVYLKLKNPLIPTLNHMKEVSESYIPFFRKRFLVVKLLYDDQVIKFWPNHNQVKVGLSISLYKKKVQRHNVSHLSTYFISHNIGWRMNILHKPATGIIIIVAPH